MRHGLGATNFERSYPERPFRGRLETTGLASLIESYPLDLSCSALINAPKSELADTFL